MPILSWTKVFESSFTLKASLCAVVAHHHAIGTQLLWERIIIFPRTSFTSSVVNLAENIWARLVLTVSFEMLFKSIHVMLHVSYCMYLFCDSVSCFTIALEWSLLSFLRSLANWHLSSPSSHWPPSRSSSLDSRPPLLSFSLESGRPNSSKPHYRPRFQLHATVHAAIWSKFNFRKYHLWLYSTLRKH